jgi:small GTP-binding protein
MIDMLNEVVSYLNATEIALRVALVSRQWYRASQVPLLWQSTFLTRYGIEAHNDVLSSNPAGSVIDWIRQYRDHRSIGAGHKLLRQYSRLLPSNAPKHQQMVKCVVVGDPDVGKNAMIVRQLNGVVPGDYAPLADNSEPCMIHSFFSLIISNNLMMIIIILIGVGDIQGHHIQMHIWNTSGQEEYERLRPLTYPGADIYIFTFDLTNSISLDHVRTRWMPEIRHYAGAHPLTLVVGTKSDIRKQMEREFDLKCTGGLRSKLKKKKLSGVDYDDNDGKDDTPVAAPTHDGPAVSTPISTNTDNKEQPSASLKAALAKCVSFKQGLQVAQVCH